MVGGDGWATEVGWVVARGDGIADGSEGAFVRRERM